jgi:hypothetical protein
LAAHYTRHLPASHLFRVRLSKSLEERGDGGCGGEGGKMPGNSQPMQCGNSSMNYKDLKKKEKLSRNGLSLKLTRGCAHGQRAEGCRWWFGDAWSGCPVAQPRLPINLWTRLQTLPRCRQVARRPEVPGGKEVDVKGERNPKRKVRWCHRRERLMARGEKSSRVRQSPLVLSVRA